MSQCWWPCFCRPFRLAGFATTHTKEQIIADALNELPVLLPPVDRHSRNTHTRPVIKLDCPTCGRQYSKSRAQINSTSETLGLGGIRRLTQNEKLRRRTCYTRTAARKNEIIVNKPAERETHRPAMIPIIVITDAGAKADETTQRFGAAMAANWSQHATGLG